MPPLVRVPAVADALPERVQPELLPLAADPVLLGCESHSTMAPAAIRLMIGLPTAGMLITFAFVVPHLRMAYCH
jgi:hypothetical protein